MFVYPLITLHNMNILSIDFGQKRIGLAWLQSGIDVILPFGIVEGLKGFNALIHISTASFSRWCVCFLLISSRASEIQRPNSQAKFAPSNPMRP